MVKSGIVAQMDEWCERGTLEKKKQLARPALSKKVTRKGGKKPAAKWGVGKNDQIRTTQARTLL